MSYSLDAALTGLANALKTLADAYTKRVVEENRQRGVR